MVWHGKEKGRSCRVIGSFYVSREKPAVEFQALFWPGGFHPYSFTFVKGRVILRVTEFSSMHCYRVGSCFPDADISFRRIPTAAYERIPHTAFKLFRFSVAADINCLFATIRRNADRYPLTDRHAALTRCDQGQITADIANIRSICRHGFTGYGHVVCTGHGQFSADSCAAFCFHHYINFTRSGRIYLDRQIAGNCLQDRQDADIRAACILNPDIIDLGTVDKHTLAVDGDTGILPFIFLAQSGSTVRQT